MYVPEGPDGDKFDILVCYATRGWEIMTFLYFVYVFSWISMYFHLMVMVDEEPPVAI